MTASVKTGRIRETIGVKTLGSKNKGFLRFKAASIGRYVDGDWGDMTDLEKRSNDIARQSGDQRILAVYTKKECPEWSIWIVTEPDHRTTTILFPEE